MVPMGHANQRCVERAGRRALRGDQRRALHRGHEELAYSTNHRVVVFLEIFRWEWSIWLRIEQSDRQSDAGGAEQPHGRLWGQRR